LKVKRGKCHATLGGENFRGDLAPKIVEINSIKTKWEERREARNGQRGGGRGERRNISEKKLYKFTRVGWRRSNLTGK